MAIVVTHSKTLVTPSTGSDDKVYGSDYVSASSHALKLNSGFLVGRTTAGNGTAEEITVGTGLTLSAGTLSAAAGLTIGTTTITSGGAGGILFDSGPGTLQEDTTNFLYTTSSGPMLQVGSGSTTSAGFILGYSGSTGFAGIFPAFLTPSTTNYAIRLQADGNALRFNAATTSGSIYFDIAGSNKATLFGTAGQGFQLNAGTATTDVAALSITRTNSNAAVGTTVPWVGWDFTDTTSNSAALAFRIRGGSAATTVLISVDKNGLVSAPTVNTTTGRQINGILDTSVTAPTVSSGFGTSPVITANGTATFRVNVGTGGTASSGVLTMPAASNGWNAQIQVFNASATNLLHTTYISASATNSITLQNALTSTGVATAWAASTVLIITATAY